MTAVNGLALLDELLVDAWRPEIVEIHDTWWFRWASGVSRRANSAFAAGSGNGEVAELVEAAEAFYADRDSPPLFQVSSASAPPSLAGYLSARGYRPSARTFVTKAATADVLQVTAAGPWVVQATTEATDTWLSTYWAVNSSRFATDHARRVCRLLLSPQLPKVFLAIGDGDGTVAVGQIVIAAGWAAVQCMATETGHRRRGAAGSVLHHLAAEAAARGAANLCLSVMADNEDARRLYDKVGFEVVHEYRFFGRD